MANAKESIYITDWYFTPELMLIREDDMGQPALNPESRIDRILKAKAGKPPPFFFHLHRLINLKYLLSSSSYMYIYIYRTRGQSICARVE